MANCPHFGCINSLICKEITAAESTKGLAPQPTIPENRPTGLSSPNINLGWECPRCHQCFAPYVSKCTSCKPVLSNVSSMGG